MEPTMLILVGVAILFLAILLFVSYVKAPPSSAFIISGLSKEPRVLIGSGGFRIPFFERLDRVYLGQITVDIKTEESVPTTDFINVDVDAVAKIRVMPTNEGTRLAAKNFLNMIPNEIAEQLQDSLQGNMREIIGTLDLRSLNTDRDGFSDQVMTKAQPDMAKLGIEIISCNIQNVTDKEGLIKDLGADNTAKIKKDASINRAIAERDVKIEVSKADKEANDARVDADTAIAIKNNELALKRAALKQQADTAQADADAAYAIQQQEQQKTINIKTVEAEIEKTKREQILSKEQIEIRQNQLAAEVEKKADADKYQIEKNAAADLEQRKRVAEAQKYEAEQRALAQNAESDAVRYRLEQEAIGIKAKGEAEAYAIQKKGEAEALAMDKKAEAYKKYNNAAVAQMMIEVLPQIVENVAKPISSIKDVHVYSGGQDTGAGVASMSGGVPVAIKQAFDVLKSATGVDMADIMRAGTIDAKVNRNINLNDEARGVVDNVIKDKG
ncbi:MAG: flotillin family protein [Prevotella sp.]|nr:flotillin family protein [Prevotella sp.]